MPRPSALDLRNPADAFGTAMLTGRNPDGSLYSPPDPSVEAALAGEVLIASDDLLLAAGETGTFHLANPAGSGVNLVVLELRAWCNTDLGVTFTIGGTFTGPIITPVRSILGLSGADAAGIARIGKGTVTGGTAGPAARVAPGESYQRKGPLVIPQGMTAAFAVVAPSGLGASAATAGSCTWREVAA